MSLLQKQLIRASAVATTGRSSKKQPARWYEACAQGMSRGEVAFLLTISVCLVALMSSLLFVFTLRPIHIRSDSFWDLPLLGR